MKKGGLRRAFRAAKFHTKRASPSLPLDSKVPNPDDFPTKVERIVFEKIHDWVNERKSYYHVCYYSLFFFLYMGILYAQGCLFQSYEVVSSLRDAVVPGQELSSKFPNGDALLQYIGRRLVLPVWQDPVCGDNQCQWPWEYPAFGRFGCKADCGQETNTTRVLLQIKANFGGELSISPRTLMSNTRWNVCLNDTDRAQRGQEAICWFAEDQGFTEIVETRLIKMDLIKGAWYVKVTGDFTQKVHGRLFDVSTSTQPIEITSQVTSLTYSSPENQKYVVYYLAPMEWMQEKENKHDSIPLKNDLDT